MKQRCGSNQYIERNDKLEMPDRIFISHDLCQGKSKTVERHKERECKRQSVAGQER